MRRSRVSQLKVSIGCCPPNQVGQIKGEKGFRGEVKVQSMEVFGDCGMFNPATKREVYLESMTTQTEVWRRSWGTAQETQWRDFAHRLLQTLPHFFFKLIFFFLVCKFLKDKNHQRPFDPHFTLNVSNLKKKKPAK